MGEDELIDELKSEIADLKNERDVARKDADNNDYISVRKILDGE
jgi:hypothetical protein